MPKMSPQSRAIAAAAILYLAVFSYFSILAHRGLQTQMNDLGSMDQSIWQASRGNLSMPLSNLPGGETASRLSVHANFIFWLIAVFYRLWPNPEFLLFLTSLACCLAGAGLYFFSRRHLGESWWSLVPPLAFWLSPMVHDANLFDFHILTVAAAMIVWSAWAFEAGRLKTGWICAVLAMSCKEDMPLAVFFLGTYLALTGRRKQGGQVMLAAALYSGLLLLMAHFYFQEGRQVVSELGYRYKHLGNTPAEILTAVFRRPGEVLSLVSAPSHMRLPVYFLLSGGLAGLTAWPMLLLLAPSLLVGLLSSIAWSTRITGTYYWVVSEAVIIMACVIAAGKKIKVSPKSFSWQLAYLGIATIIFSLIFSPLPYGLGASFANFSLPPERAALQEAAKLVPEEAELCVQNNLGPHLFHRPSVRTFPSRCNMKKAEYVLVFLRCTGGPDSGFFVRTFDLVIFQRPVADYLNEVGALMQSPEWGLIFQKDGFYLFRRGAPQPAAPEAAARKFRDDARLMTEAREAAAKNYFSWSAYLTAPYTWKDVLRLLGF